MKIWILRQLEMIYLKVTIKDTTANFKHIIGANDHRFGIWVFSVRGNIIRITVKKGIHITKKSKM